VLGQLHGMALAEDLPLFLWQNGAFPCTTFL